MQINQSICNVNRQKHYIIIITYKLNFVKVDDYEKNFRYPKICFRSFKK